MRLSKRLQVIADMIPNDSHVIDVGTDHGLLAIYLNLEKHCHVLATDVNIKALNNAQKNILKYHADVKTKCTDGLDNIPVQDDDYIVIAGMGTQTIKHILNNKKLSHHLILASQHQIRELRCFMTDLGYRIIDEKYLVDKNQDYIIMHFVKGHQAYSELELCYGPILIANHTYLEKVLQRLKTIQKEVTENSSLKDAKQKEINDIENLLKKKGN